jgi:hypothetical protein
MKHGGVWLLSSGFRVGYRSVDGEEGKWASPYQKAVGFSRVKREKAVAIQVPIV